VSKQSGFHADGAKAFYTDWYRSGTKWQAPEVAGQREQDFREAHDRQEASGLRDHAVARGTRVA